MDRHVAALIGVRERRCLGGKGEMKRARNYAWWQTVGRSDWSSKCRFYQGVVVSKRETVAPGTGAGRGDGQAEGAASALPGANENKTHVWKLKFLTLFSLARRAA